MVSDGQQTFGHYFGLLAGLASISGLILGLEARRRVTEAEKRLDLMRAELESDVEETALGSLPFNKKLKNPYPIQTSGSKCGYRLRVAFRGCKNKKKTKALGQFMQDNDVNFAGDYCHLARDQRAVDLSFGGPMTQSQAHDLANQVRRIKGLRVTKTHIQPNTCEV